MTGTAGNGLYADRHFQNAYTTRDIDAAARMFAERHGIASFHFIRDIPLGPDATIHIALAWAGDVMIELIQPNGSGDNLYSTTLPPDGQLIRFHHLGHLVADDAGWERICTAADHSGLPIALKGCNYGLNYLYLDAKAELGHYLEYVYLTGDSLHFFDAVPRY
jgi:hypothetical protein